MAHKSVVTVSMKRENGWYMATSPDLEGLAVCHQHFVEFTQEIPECIKLLYKANYGIDVEVEELPSIASHDMTRVVFEAVKKAA